MADARPDLAELYAKARGADIAAVAGTPLFKAGRRLRGECPICGASKGKKAEGAFSVEPKTRIWYCFGGCLDGGDVIDLEQRLRGGTPREAAERLAGAPVVRPSLVRTAEPRRVEAAKPAPSWILRDFWEAAEPHPLHATGGAAYLGARGIWGPTLALPGRSLRFHRAAPWAWNEAAGAWWRAPAIVGRVETPGGPTGGAHVTYLAKALTAKARLDPAKRMWGPQRDAAGRPGCVWLSPRDGPGPLIVAEGIESALSAAQLYGRPCRVAAALSLGALQGGWLADAWGRIDPACVRGDPARPAFTWPGQGEVIVAVDRDMKPITIKVRKLGGGTTEHRLGPEERARICAGLAMAAWTAAGANVVRAIAPAAGRDFNDELRERIGA